MITQNCVSGLVDTCLFPKDRGKDTHIYIYIYIYVRINGRYTNKVYWYLGTMDKLKCMCICCELHLISENGRRIVMTEIGHQHLRLSRHGDESFVMTRSEVRVSTSMSALCAAQLIRCVGQWARKSELCAWRAESSDM